MFNFNAQLIFDSIGTNYFIIYTWGMSQTVIVCKQFQQNYRFLFNLAVITYRTSTVIENNPNRVIEYGLGF